MSKLQTPASKPKKTPQRVPTDDTHNLPPVNRRVKNKPRKTKARVIHRADDPRDGGDMPDVPFYYQLPGSLAREIF